MGAEKERKRLDEDHKRRAEIAYWLAHSRMVEACRRWPGIDISSFFALKITERIYDFDESKSKLSTWAFRQLEYAVAEALRDHFGGRGNFRKQLFKNGALVDLVPDRDPEKDFDRVDGDDHVADLLSKLMPREREIVSMICCDGLPAKDVAEKLGVQKNTVYVTFHKAMERLRKHLASVA